MAKGNFIEYVVSDNPNKYPNDGEQGGYWYKLVLPALISFTIAGILFQAEEGMTWGEWVASNYSSGTGVIVEEESGYIKIADSGWYIIDADNDQPILSTDIIKQSASYKALV